MTIHYPLLLSLPNEMKEYIEADIANKLVKTVHLNEKIEDTPFIKYYGILKKYKKLNVILREQRIYLNYLRF